MAGTLSVVRLHLAVRWQVLFSLVGPLCLFWGDGPLFDVMPDTDSVGWFPQSMGILVWTLHAATVVTNVLPFALSLGLTRAAYYAGTVLYLVARSSCMAILMAVVATFGTLTTTAGENAKLAFSDLPGLLAYFFAVLVLLSAVGLVGGVASRQGSRPYVLHLLVAIAALAVAVGWRHVTGQSRSSALSFTATSATSLAALAALAAASGYLILRRADV